MVMSTACASWNNHLQLVRSVPENTRYLNRTIVLYRGKVRYFRGKSRRGATAAGQVWLEAAIKRKKEIKHTLLGTSV